VLEMALESKPEPLPAKDEIVEVPPVEPNPPAPVVKH
jgi:hypothetical protein